MDGMRPLLASPLGTTTIYQPAIDINKRLLGILFNQKDSLSFVDFGRQYGRESLSCKLSDFLLSPLPSSISIFIKCLPSFK